MVTRRTMEILCCAGEFLMMSVIGAALLQSRALCGSCCDEGHSDRYITSCTWEWRKAKMCC